MISIAMATYNGEKYLREQIDSILNQTYKDFELIICDDCSTDSTVQIIESYIDPRIKLFINKKNLGFKKNFEKAIKLCTGDYIALSDQDDIWKINKLELCINNIGEHDLICTNSEIINSENISENYTMKEVLKIKKVPLDQSKIFAHLVNSNFIQGCTILAKKDFIISTLPIPEDFRYHDYWFGIMASINNGVKYLDVTTLRYRKHDNQITTNLNNNCIKEKIRIHPKDKLFLTCDEYLYDLNLINKIPTLNEKQKLIINKTIKYHEHMKDKDFYTLKFFINNYDIIYFDKNILRKTIRISRRIIGLLIYKLTKFKNRCINNHC